MTLSELQAQREALLRDLAIARVQVGDLAVDHVLDKRRTLEILDAEISKLTAGSASRLFTIQSARGFNS